MHRIVQPRDEKGQAMTEFAVVLPVVALVLFAIVQFGIAFNNYLTLTDAVRRGARTAAVSRQTGSGLAGRRRGGQRVRHVIQLRRSQSPSPPHGRPATTSPSPPPTRIPSASSAWS